MTLAVIFVLSPECKHEYQSFDILGIFGEAVKLLKQARSMKFTVQWSLPLFENIQKQIREFCETKLNIPEELRNLTFHL